MYDRNRNFYRNTETDRNRNFSTETEITETETKPNLFSIGLPLILEIKQTTNHSWNISTQNNLLLQIHFQINILPVFSGKIHFFFFACLWKRLSISMSKSSVFVSVFQNRNYRNTETRRNTDFTEFPNRNRNFGRTLTKSDQRKSVYMIRNEGDIQTHRSMLSTGLDSYQVRMVTIVHTSIFFKPDWGSCNLV